jgi:hypothetical protein
MSSKKKISGKRKTTAVRKPATKVRITYATLAVTPKDDETYDVAVGHVPKNLASTFRCTSMARSGDHPAANLRILVPWTRESSSAISQGDTR